MAFCIVLLKNVFSNCFEKHDERNVQYGIHSDILSGMVNLACAPTFFAKLINAYTHVVFKISWMLVY